MKIPQRTRPPGDRIGDYWVGEPVPSSEWAECKHCTHVADDHMPSGHRCCYPNCSCPGFEE